MRGRRGKPLSPPASLPARLSVVVDGKGALPDVYEFGSALFGQVVTHRFTLRNDGNTPAALARVQLSCGCLSTSLPTQPGKPLPVLMPGANLNVDVTLHTARAPDAVATSPLSGGQIEKQVRIYTAGQPIHAALTLSLRGRIVSGVDMQPSIPKLRQCADVQGPGRRIVRIVYNAALYREGRTRLAAPKHSPVRVTLLPSSTRTPTCAPCPNATRPPIVRSYRVAIPPHTPIGALVASCGSKDWLRQRRRPLPTPTFPFPLHPAPCPLWRRCREASMRNPD